MSYVAKRFSSKFLFTLIFNSNCYHWCHSKALEDRFGASEPELEAVEVEAADNH